MTNTHPKTKLIKLAFLAAPVEEAQRALKKFQQVCTIASPEEADVLVALGGDGFMLHVLHRHQALAKPVYGINFGSVGFLMNADNPENLYDRISSAQVTALNPLKMTAYPNHGKPITAHAINEVSLLRQTSQAAKIRIYSDGIQRLESLSCDGILLATPAGSTAYNLSAHGPIIPMGANLLAMTPISAFRPRHWRGALLPDRVKTTFEILEPEKRSVSATADYLEVRDVLRVEIEQDNSIAYTLLFDPDHNLEERIIREQFFS